MSKEYCVILNPNLSSIEILSSDLGGAASLKYSEIYSTRDTDGTMILNFIWDWNTFCINPGDEDELESETEIVKDLLNSFFPIDTRKEYWFIPSPYDGQTKKYSNFIYHRFNCKDKQSAETWIEGPVTGLDECCQKFTRFAVNNVTHKIPSEWKLYSEEQANCIKWIERHYDNVLLYGSNPINQSVNPVLDNRVESLDSLFNNEEAKNNAINTCFKLFAVEFLLNLNRPRYFNYVMANNLPRAMSKLKSDFSGYTIRDAIYNGSSIEDLIPYINQVCCEVLKR